MASQSLSPNDLGGNDDLVAAVHRCLGRVALDDAFAGGHLGAFGVSDVGLELLAFAVLAWWATCYKLPRGCRLGAQGIYGALRLGSSASRVPALSCAWCNVSILSVVRSSRSAR